MKMKIIQYHSNDKKFQKLLVEKFGEGINLNQFFKENKSVNESLEEFANRQSSVNTSEESYLYGLTSLFSRFHAFVFEDFSAFVKVIANFLSISTIFFNNLPDRVIQSLKARPDLFEFSDIQQYSKAITVQQIKRLQENLNLEIIGQNKAKKRFLLTLGRYLYTTDNKPLVIAFIGPQGVGKTEMAKVIANSLFPRRKFVREQLSMFQNDFSRQYLFGGSNEIPTFAKTLLQRESNVVLLDELNLLPVTFSSAFYQLFDDGIFEDHSYTVRMNKAIFICTANYSSKQEMAHAIGFPLFSRFDAICTFSQLTPGDYKTIAEHILAKKVTQFSKKYSKSININEIQSQLLSESGIFPDVRNLSHYIDDLITDQVFEKSGIHLFK
ncbi:AAA family ATPase [Schleiferilactobacillus perolens]|jgi:ATP-dependent Clp protease ATP-binding subunit ClpA|uniref:AAA family ATPase n=1 Tax=Schleiferilactobacillus perolens TaxID=100468 RepID=UPI0023525EC2|nr:AAA family ATPase [Schleiferilactobacillus perolens]MCI2171558.1 AAA family ATPase [Schleiferilactobacillus perolens]